MKQDRIYGALSVWLGLMLLHILPVTRESDQSPAGSIFIALLGTFAFVTGVLWILRSISK